MNHDLENATKAAQCADLLCQDLRALAITDNLILSDAGLGDVEVDDRGLFNSAYCRKCSYWREESEHGGNHCKKYSLRNKYLPECCGRDNGRELPNLKQMEVKS